VNTPYYFYKRPEILAEVPIDARRALDIGCAAGELGLSIKARQPCHVIGIEIVADVAALAVGKLDEVRVGDAFVQMEKLADQYFDVILMADVLEHVADHEGLLRMARRKLAPAGHLILSVPNVGHWSILRELIQGYWTYQEQGILDRTHLRFYTRRSIIDTLMRNGFALKSMNYNTAPGAPAGLTDTLRTFGLNVDSFDAESQVYQYIINAVPAG
jgi:2-polyprenyl-3-methyl-5-hydroxy-6-metoxy-1,4-benzoquinol methylase